MSLASVLTRLDETKDRIKVAIEAKGVTVGVTDTFETDYALRIGDITTGGGVLTGYVVTYHDYDGTEISTERVEDGEDSTPPTPPTHAGLTFYAWDCGATSVIATRHITALYYPTDGKTHVFADISSNYSLTTILYLTKSDTSELTISWGDGSEDTLTSGSGALNFTHVFAQNGSYEVTIWVSSGAGTYYMGQGTSGSKIFGGHTAFITEIWLAAGIVTVPDYFCNSGHNLTKICMPSSITSIGAYSFTNCYSLKHIGFPNAVATLGILCLQNAYSIKYQVFSNSFTTIGSQPLKGMVGLKFLSIPFPGTTRTVTASANSLFMQVWFGGDNTVGIDSDCYYGDSYSYVCTLPSAMKELVVTNTFTASYGQFSGCPGLERLTLPNAMTAIPEKFFRGSGKISVRFPDSLSLYSAFNLSAFRYFPVNEFIIPTTVATFNVQYLSVLKTLVIPANILTFGIGYAFAIEELTIPSTVQYLSSYAFGYCHSLKTLDIPSSISAIPTYCFTYTESLTKIILRKTSSIVTLASTNAFNDKSYILKIYVPDALLETYKAATNWTSLSNFIFPLSDIE